MLLAYSLTWPDRTIMLIFPPVAFRAIWLIPGLFVMTLMMDPGGNVSHVGHLGGVLVGWLYLQRSGQARKSASRSRSSSTAGVASACGSGCAPCGTTNSRRGAAATTIARCTEAMTHPTRSPDFVIAEPLGGEIARAASSCSRARSVVALTGAGLSVESGIPPFRGPGGLWTKYGEPPLDGYQRFLRDPKRAWQDRLSPREPWAQALAETLAQREAQRRPPSRSPSSRRSAAATP